MIILDDLNLEWGKWKKSSEDQAVLVSGDFVVAVRTGASVQDEILITKVLEPDGEKYGLPQRRIHCERVWDSKDVPEDKRRMPASPADL